jgi:hypothetical protein
VRSHCGEMATYFNLHAPTSEYLLADGSKSAPGQKAERKIVRCTLNPEHIDSNQRISPAFFQVEHNRRNEMIIWSWGNGYIVHQTLLAEFKAQGFSGYQTRPAAVRFRDHSISLEYREFIVIGWAGVARPESGIRLVKSCPSCHMKRYSPISDFDRLIDWQQWTGEDFFMVWPLPLFTLITERVANWLLSHKIKSYALGGIQDLDPLVLKAGFGPGRLSDYLPEELAIKYGNPLDL